MLSSVLLFFSFSGSEIMLILFVALILFGGDKFPEIARGLGKGIREFKDMSDGVKREIHSQINSYDLDNRPATPGNIVDTTDRGQQAEIPAHFEEHETHDISAVTPTHDAPQHDTHDVSVLPHHNAVPDQATTATNAEVPAAEKPALPKPDLTPPSNTISRQSY